MIIKLDLGNVNAYLVKENDNFMLVDTGGYLFADKGNPNNRREVLEEKLAAAGVTKENLKLLVITHGDCDHCMNAAYIAKKYEVPIAMHKADVPMVQNPNLELLLRTVHYRKTGMKLVAKLIHGLIVKLTEKTIEDFERFTPDILLEDGERLNPYGFHAAVIHLPGHTPGSIGLVTDDGEAILGDAGEGTINAVDFAEFDRSVAKIKKAGYKVVYVGH